MVPQGQGDLGYRARKACPYHAFPHQPPSGLMAKKFVPKKTVQVFYPHCTDCSQLQGTSVRTGPYGLQGLPTPHGGGICGFLFPFYNAFS